MGGRSEKVSHVGRWTGAQVKLSGSKPDRSERKSGGDERQAAAAYLSTMVGEMAAIARRLPHRCTAECIVAELGRYAHRRNAGAIGGGEQRHGSPFRSRPCGQPDGDGECGSGESDESRGGSHVRVSAIHTPSRTFRSRV